MKLDKNKVVVITEGGFEISLEQWQKQYGLEIGSDKIGKYFSLTEKRFRKDIELFGKLVVNALLIRVMDAYRVAINKSVTVNAFNRNKEYQSILTAKGFRTAKFSPHEVYLAVDIDTPGVDDLRKLYPKLTDDKLWDMAVEINRDRTKILIECAKKLNIKIRIGNESYLKDGSTFLHVDVCPEYYAKGKPYHIQHHPKVWEVEARW